MQVIIIIERLNKKFVYIAAPTTPRIPTSNDNRYAILHVDINLGPNQTDRIIVYEGDTPDSLAEEFALEHSILILIHK